jgi:RHS repeat-associated protein
VSTGTQYSFLSGTLSNTYAYDAASNRTSFTDPAGGESTYTYDSLNRLTELANTVTGNFGFGYDDLGRRTSLTRPNGVDTSYSYDNLSRLLSVLHNNGSLPGSTNYTVDAAGNRTSKTALQQADPTPVSVTSSFSYDNIYQLTQAVVGGNLAESYSFDAVGNRLTSLDPASYTYNSSNQLTATSSATYAYDSNGNTTSKTDTNGNTYYTWDYENRLASVTLPGQGGTVYFNYDPFGRRIRKAFGSATTIYAYDGDNITEELDSGGNLVTHYTQSEGVDEPLALTGTGGTYYYHADGLGSITSLTNGSGQLAASYVYDSFGKLTTSTGSITNPFQYTGREFDSETGLYYYRARYYGPSAGRFLSEDRLRAISESVNFYQYVENGPIDLTDPSGFCPCPAASGLRLVPTSDCSYRGYRRIVYTLQTLDGSDPSIQLYVTEHQDPKSAAPAVPQMNTPEGQSTDPITNEFDDTIFGHSTKPSNQTFTVSSEDPTKSPNTESCPVLVRLPTGPNGKMQDYGTLGIWRGGTTGYYFINGNSTGFVPCNTNYDDPGRFH